MSPAETRSALISLSDEEGVQQVLMNSVLGLWDVVNNLTRLRPARHDRYRVTIFGSARAQAGTFGYEETKRVAAALAGMGCDIITGGGPGLMQAASNVSHQISTAGYEASGTSMMKCIGLQPSLEATAGAWCCQNTPGERQRKGSNP